VKKRVRGSNQPMLLHSLWSILPFADVGNILLGLTMIMIV
jgi:hypothetical protein